MKLVVLRKFHGIVENQDFDQGETIIVEDINRVNGLIKRGLCELSEDQSTPDKTQEGESSEISFNEKDYKLSQIKDALDMAGFPVSKKAGAKAVSKALDGLNEEQAKSLSEILDKQLNVQEEK